MDPKPFASLSAGLLARKGAARPAMRRPHMGNSTSPTLPASVQDDLGWNDMGEETPVQSAPPLTMIGGKEEGRAPEIASAAVPPVVVQQREDLAQQLSRPARPPAKKQGVATLVPASAKPLAATGARAGKAAFTLRLDPERHLRLRLACAVGNRSAQQIVTEALDAFLNSQPQLEELARQLPAPGGKASK